MTLVKVSKSWFQTCSAIIGRVRTRPALRIRYSRRAYSLAVSSIRFPPRVTSRVAGFSRRSSTCRTPAASPAPRRSRARARRHQFLDRKGFREVVVGAGIQPLHLLIELGSGGEDQDRRGNLLLAQGLENLEAGHPRQHEIQDNQVVAPRPGQIEALGAVAARIDGIALLLQRPPDEGSHL